MAEESSTPRLTFPHEGFSGAPAEFIRDMIPVFVVVRIYVLNVVVFILDVCDPKFLRRLFADAAIGQAMIDVWQGSNRPVNVSSFFPGHIGLTVGPGCCIADKTVCVPVVVQRITVRRTAGRALKVL